MTTPTSIPTSVELESGQVVQLTPTQITFLTAFRENGCVTRAAEAASITRGNHYRWLGGKHPGYEVAFEEIRHATIDDLELAARRRAIEGTRKYKFTREGTPVLKPGASADDPDPYYYETVYSDRLLELLLRAHRPERFTQKMSQEISGPEGGPLEVVNAMRQVAVANPDLSESMCQALENVSNSGNSGIPLSGSDGDTSGFGVDD